MNRKSKIKQTEKEVVFAPARKKPKAKDLKGSLIKLIKYIRPYYVPVVFVILFNLVSVALTIYGTLLLKDLTNSLNAVAKHFIDGGGGVVADILDYSYIVKTCVTLIIAYGGCALLSYFQAFILAKVNQGVTRKLRSEISGKINRLPLKYFDNNPLGDTMSRVTNDVDTIGQSLNQAISTTVSSIFQLVGVLIAMFALCWQLGFTTMATVPFNLLVVIIFMKFSQKHFVRQQKYLGAVNGTIEETFSGQTIVKAFNAEERAKKQFDEFNDALQKANFKSSSISGLMHPFMTFLSKVGYVAVCVVGGILYVNGKCDFGTITAFLIYVNMFQQPIGQLGQIMNVLQTAAAASERVFEFLGEEEETQENAAMENNNKVCGNVEFKNVNFGYLPEKTVINDFSADIKAGQKVAIVGPTGAGKTTLVNLLMRFYELNGGDIFIDGKSIKDMTRTEVRSMFSMVLQDTWLFDGTVKENLAFSNASATDEDIVTAAKAANIDRFIETLPNNYDGALTSQTTISGGQKQLLTIARAMVQNAPMLILDEATSNVDTYTEELIQQAMDNLSKGKTSFVIAHRLSTIKNADLILVLKDGDIIEQGRHEDLLQKENGFYASMYNSQFAI